VASDSLGFWLIYAILGVLFMLHDIASRAAEGTNFKDQMKASLFLSGDDLPHLTFAMLVWVVAWPIVLVAQSGGPPTRGAT
jgi:hypothetical protein